MTHFQLRARQIPKNRIPPERLVPVGEYYEGREHEYGWLVFKRGDLERFVDDNQRLPDSGGNRIANYADDLARVVSLPLLTVIRLQTPGDVHKDIAANYDLYGVFCTR